MGGEEVGLRLAQITVVAVAAFAAVAEPACAATINVQAKAKIVKPLLLESLQDLDFGTVMLGPGTWSGATVQLSQTGVLTCPANVTCSGLTQVAQYSVSGSNDQTVTITAPDVTLVNQADSSKTLLMTVDSPASVTLTNSGKPGKNFEIGGSITLNSTTASGVYTGTFNVTAEYQ